MAHLTATGKSILSFQTEQKVNQYIKKVDFKSLTPNSITTAKELLNELDDIREKKYAADNEECEEGITSYAVPRMLKKKDVIIKKLKDSAEKIIQSLA